jgi:hypothetical protein
MDGVNTTHKDFDHFEPKWKRVRDALAGQDAVHKAGEAYLPRLNDQDDADYRAYVKRAGFYNASWRTTAGLLGMMFRKGPTVELPAQVEALAEDIDMAGTSLETFARKTALEILGPSRVGLMVDHPKVETTGPITLAAAQSQGLRPMLKLYRAESIINWRYERIANHWRLSMVVLKETVDEPDGEFKAKEVDQWRVLDLDESGFYRQRVFRKRKTGGKAEGEFELIDEFWPVMRGLNMREIPFAIVGPDGIDSELDEPAQIDLIDVNLSHYRTNADYEHGCHFTGLPTLFLAGFQNQDGSAPTFRIGSQAAVVATDPNAKGEYIEFTGQGLTSLKENLDRKEQQMAVLGARMVAEEKRVAETATTAAIHRTGENSVLASIASAVSEALEWALSMMAEWVGVAGPVVYQLNRDFNPAMLGAQEMTALLKAVQSGELSSESFFDLLQRADVVDSELTYEEERERIDAQAPSRPALAANDGLEAAA